MPRSNQTKQLLAQSLQELMATTPLEKISVNDIVDHANVCLLYTSPSPRDTR